MNNKRIPYLLVALGLLGLSLYTIVLRHNAPAFMHDDFVRGAFYGVCIGLEIWGVVLNKRQRKNAGRCGRASA